MVAFSAGGESPRESAREAAERSLHAVLSGIGYPAPREAVVRALRRALDPDHVAPAAVDSLPSRRFESENDVRLTLDVLGALPDPRT